MVHPKPATREREALYAWLLGRGGAPEALPPAVRAFEDFKAKRTDRVPDVPFQEEWNVFQRRNPGARLVLLDLQPYPTTQVVDRDDVLNVGGFSDQVFSVLADFAAGRMRASHWVGEIEAVGWPA